MRLPRSRGFLATLFLSALVGSAQTAWSQTVPFAQECGRLHIRVAGKEFATYVWEDREILRPYFSQVNAPNGMPVARTHPPDPELTRTTMIIRRIIPASGSQHVTTASSSRTRLARKP